jgi:hypothetical protein
MFLTRKIGNNGLFLIFAIVFFGSFADASADSLVAHWSLNEADYNNGNYLDTVAGLIAQPNGVPNFITGVRDEPNGAVMITLPTGWGLSQALGGDLSNGFSICLWADWNGNWQGTIDVDDLVVESNDPETEYVVTDALNADQGWQHIGITYDNTTVRVYLNGRLKLSEAGGLPPGSETVIEIGNSLREQIFNGAIDDIRLYDYPLSPTEIAQLICTPEYAPIGDVSGPYDVQDCMVDFYDLAGFPEHWLEYCIPPDCNYDFSGPYGIPDYTVNLYDLAEFSKHWLEIGW